MARNAQIENFRNCRKHPRLPGNRALVRAAWLDADGALRTGLGRLIDISEGGIALELPETPLYNSTVRFQCDQFRLYGTGHVRYGRGNYGRCVIGVQFAAGTHWKPKEAGIEEVGLPPRVVYQAPIELDWDSAQ